jgi:predicted nuclease of predicted toxin-antitoxin system
LDEGVPVSVGQILQEAGHEVIFFNSSGLSPGSPDAVVCAAADASNAILVALDGDMKRLARGMGVSGGRFKALSLLKLECFEPDAAARVKLALSLVEHEWKVSPVIEGKRRIYIVIGDGVIRTHR